MRYLIISDIHSNWEALEAVAAKAAGQYDAVVCCGDLVGYGANPNEVIRWVRENVRAVVRGNHDKACATGEGVEWFNGAARAAAFWTHERLTPGNLAYLRNLPKGPLEVDGFCMVHGSPLDEDEYVVNSRDAQELTGYLPAPVCFFGHTHRQVMFLYTREGVKQVSPVGAEQDEQTVRLEPDTFYLINPGSVGQPRDRDPRAAFAIYDTKAREVTLYRTAYDLKSAQAKIREAGLPDLLALRLAEGA